MAVVNPNVSAFVILEVALSLTITIHRLDSIIGGNRLSFQKFVCNTTLLDEKAIEIEIIFVVGGFKIASEQM